MGGGPYVFLRHVNSVMGEVGVMPSEKDKKFKARTFKVHLTKIRKYLDKDSKVVPVDPKHLGPFEHYCFSRELCMDYEVA